MNWDAIGAVAELVGAIGVVERDLFESAHRFPDQLLVRPGLRIYWDRNRNRYSDAFAAFIASRLEATVPVER